MLAILDIKLPPVPRARDDTPRQHTLSQGATLMRADSVKRVEGTINIEQCDNPASGNNFHAAAGDTIGYRSDSRPLLF